MSHESSTPSNALSVARTIKDRPAWFLVPLIAVTVLAYAVTTTIEPQYDATAIVLAGQGEGIADVTAVDAINKATQTLARMSTTRVVAEGAIRELGLDGDRAAEDVVRRTRANVPPNTQQIELTVRDPEPETARDLANSMAEVFSEMVEKRAGGQSDLSATVWQSAIKPEHPATPNLLLNTLAGLLAGAVVGTLFALWRQRVDQSWNDEDEIESLLGISVLASVPDISTRSIRKRSYT